MATSQDGVCLAVRGQRMQVRESFGLELDNHCFFLELCNSPGCTGTCLVDQDGLELREIHLSLSGLDKHCEWK